MEGDVYNFGGFVPGSSRRREGMAVSRRLPVEEIVVVERDKKDGFMWELEDGHTTGRSIEAGLDDGGRSLFRERPLGK